MRQTSRRARRRTTTTLGFLIAIGLSWSPVPASADVPTGLVDTPIATEDVRQEYLERALAPMWQLAQVRRSIERSRAGGERVLVSTEQNDDYRYLLFVPERDGDFPVDTAGAYILRRKRSDGSLDQLKIFLRSDPGFFVRIWPDRQNGRDGTQRSLMSLFVAGVQLYRDIPLPIPIDVLLAEPFSRLLDLTAARVNWSIVYPATDAPAYEDVAIMAQRTRAALPTLPDAEDGAMDANGNLVFIESLVLQDQQPGFNCSGFAKWVVDGLAMPLFGHYLAIEPLKEKHLYVRGHRWSDNREEDRDPYFGLDWTRNLATTMLSAEQGGREVDPEAADVRNVAFNTYVEDVGYPVVRLPQVLYLLAQTEPGYFYIGSVNREYGNNPTLHQHVHVVVFFPYFDDKGQFFVDVMERNVETSLLSLDDRYHDDYVHLVRVRADRSYAPPVIRN